MTRNSKYFFIIFSVLSIVLLTIVLSGNRSAEELPKDLQSKPDLVDMLGFLNLHDSVEYVGIEKCKQCHADMYESYIRTGMGQSWGAANHQKSASVFHKDKILYDEKSGFYYQPYWSGDKMMVLEFMLDGTDTVYKRLEQVDFVVGSGQHTNSHILNVNGYLFQVPFTYYTQIGMLDFPPGFEDGNNARFSRLIGTECISCHNSYPKHIEGSVNKYEEVPLGINCERCHGPGELHVNAMEAGLVVDTKKETDYTIVNPKRLPADLKFEICLRCHSQGNSVLKDGRTFFDFKPGMHVSEVLDVFREVYENEEDAFWMETHPERLKQSKCFIETQNHPDFEPMTCLTCHFTSSMKHISFKETPLDIFKAICISCHNQNKAGLCSEKENIRKAQEDNCIKCHMVKTGVFDIPHVMISDHHIRITDKWKEPIKSTNEIETGKFLGLKCMTQEKPDRITWARAYIYHYEKFYNDPGVLDSAYYYLKGLSEKQYFRDWIYYYYLKRDYNRIVELSKKYHSEETEEPMMNYQIGQAYHNSGFNQEALKYFKLAVKYQPYNLDYRNKLGTEYLNLKKYDLAKAEFEFMIKEDPSLSIAYNNLGFIFLIRKQYDLAQKNFIQSLRLDPDYKNASLNLANTYLQSGQYFKAKSYLQQLDKKYPDDGQIENALKMLE